MCGIFGVLTIEDKISSGKIKKLTRALLKYSESRGKESSGLTVLTKDKIKVYKLAKPAHVLVKSENFEKLFVEAPKAVIGHARLVTNGSLEDNQNNQPVIKDRIVGIHNGIVTNVDDLWRSHKDLKKISDVDTEVILALIRKYFQAAGNLAESVRRTFAEIEGSASIALFFEDLNCLLLASNTGSLYMFSNEKIAVFASESLFLKKALKSLNYSQPHIKQILPGTGFIIDLKNLEKTQISLAKKNLKVNPSQANRKIEDLSLYPEFYPPKFTLKVTGGIKAEFAKFNRQIRELRRCTRCILPETLPFIEFDDKGVCNYCRNYKRKTVKGDKVLREVLKPFRRKDGQPDCLISFSGGRDSSYGLHYVKKILKMNPIVYSYDWGMITDLGRRNQARMTGKLGVEQILVSADIAQKRSYIKKNVLAWLKKPDLGTVPLFMAGDKQYFYYANKVSKELGLKLIILCINPFEKTDFKFGFCGVRPDQKVFYRLAWLNKAKLAAYYGRAYLNNPAYINSSLIDTTSAFISYYFISHDYLSFYDYISWDEEEISKTLIGEYNWEIAPDTKTTWRIGDGTASFYNYIYYVLAGFTENDTFRSNQIREGKMTRKKALKLSEIENQPRWESIQWYADTIGIDAKQALETINRAKKIYQ